ncbi:hypothetical protein GCM10007918_20670 [Piscinibacter gummiphilus]|nr:hypothetical protein GCM10007918_20670 [Piscinibacter gummiphilus]
MQQHRQHEELRERVAPDRFFRPACQHGRRHRTDSQAAQHAARATQAALDGGARSGTGMERVSRNGLDCINDPALRRGDARFGIAAFRKVIGISRRRCVRSRSRASGA